MRPIDADKLIGQIFKNPWAGTHELIDMIHDMPTETVANTWIPVTERMPNREEYVKNDGRFILDDGNRRYQGIFDIYDGKFKFSKHVSGLNYELIEDNCVIAWQPLPEPWEGDK